MKIIPKEKLQDFSLPLPIYSAIRIADAIAQDGEEFDVYVGLQEKNIEQLKKLSLDKNDLDLQNHTGDRARFGEGSYEYWYEKGRTPFCLINKRSDALASLVWFGPKPLGEKSIRFRKDREYEDQNIWHTISCRSYPPFRGKGNMGSFANFVIDVYKSKFPNTKIWAGTDDRNIAMVKLTTELGFELDAEHSDLPEHWMVTVKK
jgi:hypothetical protein